MEENQVLEPPATAALKKFDVHLYCVVRLKVEDVEAHNMLGAIEEAEMVVDPYTLFNYNSVVHRDGVHKGNAEFAEDYSHYIVDPHINAGEEFHSWVGEDPDRPGVLVDVESARCYEDNGHGVYQAPKECFWRVQYRKGIEAALEAYKTGDIGAMHRSLQAAIATAD